VAVVGMLRAHGARKYLPALDPDDPQVMTDWFPAQDLGIEFGFEDQAYLRGEDVILRRKGPLVFFEVIFYGQHPQMAPYAGELPFGLSFQDNREGVRQKLARFQLSARWYRRDVWEWPEYRLVVSYLADESAIADVVVYLPEEPWKSSLDDIHALPQLREILALFDCSPGEPAFERAFRPFGVMYQLDQLDGGLTIDMTEEYGFELQFADLGRDTATSSNRRQALCGIRMYRDRDLDARGWDGQLPFDIRWNDSPTVMLRKVAVAPTKLVEDMMTGSAFWKFPEFELHVMFSLFDNLVYRVYVSKARRLDHHAG
jgi:hypothetical protein